MGPRCVAYAGDRCGEGAVWHAEEKALFWCDIGRFLLHRFDAESGALHSWSFDEPVVAVMLTRDPGRLLIGLASRLVLFRPATGAVSEHSFRLPGYPRVRFNDGRTDPAGNVWIGSMQNNVRADGELDETVEANWTRPGLGTLFRFTPDGGHDVKREQVGISNTVCWSPDGKRFYFGDTLQNEIRAYDFDAATGTIANGRGWLAGFDRGGPDGSTVDGEGYLWNCRFGGGCIVRVSPEGRIDRVLEMPCIDVTTCTFGGPDLRTLYITTASMRGHAGERLAGSVFALATDVAGFPENKAAF